VINMIGNRWRLVVPTRYRKLLPFFFVIAGLIGVAGLVHSSTTMVFHAIAPNELFTVNRYLREFFWYPAKPEEIARYCLSIIGFVAYCTWITLLIRSRMTVVMSFFCDTSVIPLGIILVTWVLVNLSLGHVIQIIPSFLLIIPWFVLLHWPFIGADLVKFLLALDGRVLQKISWAAITIGLVQAAYVYAPFIFSRPALINEFPMIPEKTLLWSDSNLTGDPAFRLKVPVEVDNQAYLREHELLRPSRASENAVARLGQMGGGVFISRSLALDEFVDGHPATSYDYSSGRLFVVSPLSSLDLEALYRLMEKEDQKSALLNEVALMQRYFRSVSDRRYTPQELEFISANAKEVHEQVLARYVLHHHAHLLSPMNDLSFSRPIEDIHFLYGFLNAWALERVLSALCGDISYQSYMQIYYSFYVIYILMFCGVCMYIFRNPLKAGVAILVAVMAGTAIGFDEIMLAPGGNPLRHIFDLPVLLLVWCAVQSRGPAAMGWWIAAMMLSWVSMFNNREFGVFLSLACVACCSWHAMIECDGSRRWGLLGLCLLGLLCTGMCFYFASIGAEGYNQYFIRGVLGFPFKEWRMTPVLCVFGLISWVLLSNWSFPGRVVSPEVKMMWFLALLFFMLFTYYVWFPISAHFWTILPLFAILAVFMTDHILVRIGRASWDSPVLFSLLMMTLLADIIALGYYQWERMKFDKIFVRHHVYDWEFPRMQVRSTMDPAPFQASVAMIQRHDPTSGIHLISKYDMLLPFLAHKYSAMKYHEIGNFMVTKVEMAKVVESLRQDSPKILFVDTDIDRPSGLDIIPPTGPFGYLHDESRWKALRLGLLSDVFNQVRKDYELIESGPLLSVWRRRVE
jgi:hypothetical protein